jgi:hypothetical protein
MTQEETPCVHRWILAAPVGDETLGTCKTCGQQRTFSNAPKQGSWRIRRQSDASERPRGH